MAVPATEAGQTTGKTATATTGGAKSGVSEALDDYSTRRVPLDKRDPMWKVLLVVVGSFATVSHLMLGANLGYSMTLKNAILATIFGSVILQVVGFGLGLAGQREGLPMSLLSKWAGFGTFGSAVVGLAFSVSLIGWFGIQNTVLAKSIYDLIPAQYHLPDPSFAKPGAATIAVIALVTGLLVTALVTFGFEGLSWTSNIAFPAFVIVMAIACFSLFKNHDVVTLATMAAPGTAISLSAGTTMVTGNFIVGAIVMPDITRRAKKGRDVFWVVVVGFIVGELVVNVLGVLMAHAVGKSDITDIIFNLTGVFGIILIILSAVKMSDTNLYSASLNETNFVKQAMGKNVNRAAVTVVTGIIGTALSMFGLLDVFSQFLTLLGAVFPPVAAIIVVDYWILKTNRKDLDESRAKGVLPASSTKVPWVALVAWAVSVALGYVIKWGVQSLNVLVIAAVLYYVGMKLFGKKSGAVGTVHASDTATSGKDSQ